jgi:nitrate/nitrite-specific signal transduction histidine kinase
MLISSKLKLAAGVPAVMAVIITSALIFSNKTLETAREMGGKTQALLLDINEVNSLVHSYVLLHEERPKQQFLAQEQIIQQRLRQFRMRKPEHQALLDRLAQDSDAMRAMFLKLVENAGALPVAEFSDLVEEAEQLISGQVLARARGMVSTALELDGLVTEQISVIQQRVTLLIVVLIISTTVPLTCVLFAMMRTIKASLSRLRQGAEIVAAGDLNHRLNPSGTDELSDLGRAFDEMTKRLQETTYPQTRCARKWKSASALSRPCKRRKRGCKVMPKTSRKRLPGALSNCRRALKSSAILLRNRP